MFICPECNRQMIWQNDWDLQDIGREEEGVTSMYMCFNCNIELNKEYIEEPKDIQGNDVCKSTRKANMNFYNSLIDIKLNECKDENPRPVYKDGTPAHSFFITDLNEKYDVYNGELPFSTTRPIAKKMAINEIRWIYQFQSNKIDDAHSLGIFWWDNWGLEDGTIGQRYGATIKKYDLMNKLLEGLEKNPFGRRHVINMFQYEDFEETDGLFPCAYETQYAVREKGEVYLLDIKLIQR